MSKKNTQKKMNLLRTRRDLSIFLDEQLWYTTVLLPLANPTPPNLCHISRLGHSEAHWESHDPHAVITMKCVVGCGVRVVACPMKVILPLEIDK